MPATDAAGRLAAAPDTADEVGPRIRGGLTRMQTSPLRLRRRRSGKPYYERRWEQLDDWLRRRGPVGAGSIEIRQAGLSNPSQAAGELVRHGVAVSVIDEHPPYAHHKARPCRYWHAEHAPSGARAVKPASDPHNPSATSAPKRAGGLAVEQTPRRVGRPGRAPASPPAHQLALDLVVEHPVPPSERQAA